MIHFTRIIRLVTALIIASVFVPAAYAGKVVVFNPEAAIMGTEAAKQASADLEKDKEVASMMAEAQALRSQLENMQKESETKGLTWSVDQRNEHRQKMGFINEDFQLLAKKIQTAKNNAGMRLIEELKPKLESILKEIMAEDSIDIVLHAQAAVIVKPEADITRKVTEKLNKVK